MRMDLCWWFWLSFLPYRTAKYISMKKLRFHANTMNLLLNFSALSAFIWKGSLVTLSSSFWIRVGLAKSYSRAMVKFSVNRIGTRHIFFLNSTFKYEAARSLVFPLFHICSGITAAYAHTAASNFQFTLFYNPSSLGLISLVSLRKANMPEWDDNVNVD
ncbi:hypothetical protein MKW92_044492 [Papaver armeniacum]|nr:hypothetical protein MKW92_044492 [Papaver armeniacum]